MADSKVRCTFTVTSGVGVNTPDPKLTKTWTYMQADFDADTELLRKAKLTGKPAIRKWDTMRGEAAAYAIEALDPQYQSWVRLDMVWKD